MMAQEYWTDGYRLNSLTPQDGGLRVCRCESLYLIRQAIKVSSQDRAHSKKINSQDKAWEVEIPFAQHVDDAKLAGYLNGRTKFDQDVEIVIRRRFWRHLNHSYRDQYRSAVNGSIESIPSFKIDLEQKKNIDKLISLLEATSTNDLAELLELYRELSMFYNAQVLLRELRVEEDDKLLQLQEKLLSAKINAPVRFAY